MSYICLIANANGVALSGDSRLTLEPRFLHLHFDNTRKVFSDPSQNMAWACCGLTMYLGMNYFKHTERILRQSHRSLASRLNQISSLLSRATRLQHLVTRRDSVFVLLLSVVTSEGVQVQKLEVVNGTAAIKRYQTPVFLQGGWIPALRQNNPAAAEYAGESLEQLVARARQRCMWAMKRDQQRSQENRKHQQTIGGNIRVVTLPVPKEAEA
jgi:hypothetical protein